MGQYEKILLKEVLYVFYVGIIFDFLNKYIATKTPSKSLLNDYVIEII